MSIGRDAFRVLGYYRYDAYTRRDDYAHSRRSRTPQQALAALGQ